MGIEFGKRRELRAQRFIRHAVLRRRFFLQCRPDFGPFVGKPRPGVALRLGIERRFAGEQKPQNAVFGIFFDRFAQNLKRFPRIFEHDRR